MMPVQLKRLIPGQYRGLAEYRGFRRLLPALAVCDLGDGMSVVAIAWLALRIAGRRTGSGSGVAGGTLVGAAVAAYVLPGAVGALVLGRWLRAAPARRLVAANALLRAVFLGCIPVASACGLLHPVVYVALLGGSSLLAAWGDAGTYALVVDLVPAGQRLAANALISTSTWVSTIVGPAVAGVLAWIVGPVWIIGVDALSFVVLAVQVSRLFSPGLRTSPAELVESAEPVEPVETGRNLRMLLHAPELLGLLAITWFFNFFYGPVESALPLFVADDLHSGAGMLGLYWTVFSVGGVLGAMAAGRLRRRTLWIVLVGIIAGHGLALLPFGFPLPATHSAAAATGDIAVTLAGFAIAGLVYGPYSALSFNLFQERTPPAALTTVLAARGAILLTAAPVGAALGGPLSVAFGPRMVLAGSGIATLALAAASAVTITVLRRS
ncbi:MAG TPA: MFS transporter [Actinocrinis sp.]|nr:MFS transporter [Actinocrinis sp.]